MFILRKSYAAQNLANAYEVVLLTAEAGFAKLLGGPINIGQHRD